MNRELITVLVVEDNDDARAIFAELLRAREYKVLEAANGIDALSVLNQKEVHIVLTDMRMPDMDGLDFAMVVKNSAALAHIPIILLSATPLTDTWAVLNIFDASLVKPCAIEVLSEAIDRQAALVLARQVS